MTSKPNIVYLHTHDTGRWVQPYGYPVPTPRIQQFAQEGILFRNAHSAAPTCSPSRAALLTGQCPHSAGMLGLAHMGFGLHDYGQHLVHTLHAAGYTSAMAGVQHVAPGPDEGAHIGYDEQLPVADNRASSAAAAAEEYLSRHHDRPFFLSVGLVETHILPREGHTFGYPGVDDRYVIPPSHIPDTPRSRRDFASFVAAADAADAAFGRVLDALDAAGLGADTLVIITTDHGLPLPRMKSSLSDLGTGVMLLLRGPGGFDGGQVSDGLVSQLDLFPTLCDLLEIDHPPWLQGRSLLPLVRAGVEVNEHLFSEVTYHVAYDPQRSVRTSRYRYVVRFDDREHPVLPNVDDCPTKDVWVEAGWQDLPAPREQLYDVLLDPAEVRNLVGDPSYEDTRSRLADVLRQWMQDTDDPLLSGPVPAPAGFPYVDASAVAARS